ncbi:hypothetical protein FQN57_001916 [Myotisia sp. PD_48]|nr:hypothetical protein FQN57_001916 [Myotisia sp. PD_48]
MRPFLSLMGADPSKEKALSFETSWLFSPLVFFGLRALISLYAFTTIFVIFGWQGTHGYSEYNGRTFSYFTHLSFWGLAFYFLVAAIHTFLYSRTGRSVLFDKWPRALLALHSLFFSTITVFPFLVVIVYWALLFDGTWFPDVFDSWTNVSQHAMPAFFSLFEIIFSTTYMLPLLHIPFLFLVMLLYLALAYITNSTQGFFVYPFLDPGVNGEDNMNVVRYSFGIAAAILVLFGIVWFLIWLRRRLVGPETRKTAGVENHEADPEIAMEVPK